MALGMIEVFGFTTSIVVADKMAKAADVKVVAIDKNAFSDTGSNARKIYLPTTLKAIWDNAFQGCPLTDIYFTHNTYIHGDAIPDSQGLLTIHCPQDCHNRYYYSFSDYAHTYGATWEEWNGS